jgi:hypothetical protein
MVRLGSLYHRLYKPARGFVSFLRGGRFHTKPSAWYVTRSENASITLNRYAHCMLDHKIEMMQKLPRIL